MFGTVVAKVDRFENVLFVSHTAMGGPFVVGSHHLAERMAARGHRVLHVARPFTVPELVRLGEADTRHRAQVLRARGVERGKRLLDLVPFSWVPLRLAGPIFQRTGRNPILGVTRGIERVRQDVHDGSVDLAIVDAPRYAGIEERIEADVLLYRATDLMAEMLGQPSIDEMEAALCQAADGVVATSRPVLDHLEGHAPGKPSLLLPNGVDFHHFARSQPEPPEYGSIPGPRLVYVGSLDERFDAAGVSEMARRLDEGHLVLVGPPTKRARGHLEGLDNVHLLGPRPFEEVPAYLQHADLGLLPFSDHPANQGRSPMKLYEYAASGLPVLARRTTELERREEPFCRFYDAPSEMPAAARRLLGGSLDPSAIRARAEGQDWGSKVEELLAFGRRL